MEDSYNSVDLLLHLATFLTYSFSLLALELSRKWWNSVQWSSSQSWQVLFGDQDRSLHLYN